MTDHAFQILAVGVGAFLGAFFAFLFTRAAEHSDRVENRKGKHNTALIRLEYILNETLNGLSSNESTIRHFQQVVRQGHVHWGFPKPLRVDTSIPIDLYNIEFINRVASLNEDLQRLNHDYENIRTAYNKLLDARVAGHMDPPTYQVNAELLATELEVLRKYGQHLEDVVTNLLSDCRVVCEKDRSRLDRFTGKQLRSHKVTPEEHDAERAKLDSEIAAVQQRSGEEIERATGRPAS